ncbi:cryptochrome/photolyase family protein [Ketogulonicigenium vulgare]|uniref:DNA photolyase, Cryptochrome 1 apoprotein (Blue light photoreceptor) n=1 Tax=Ketogulonicigenium vulgare (strain WSH-001) TaxID=759362 RepID=F9Y6H6_KETVW|nr:deoxyribodipyrimidine photo-lyase [Ketogulonicigenium vulgare]ADO42736.1 deoxyribodipyrimidine photolyase [Ketogulonicigenium vulgare Y25]AEM40922.1 DNA photolyase, Cryptochrome 1 apoprotein (Blue light photoreceptor) [Ketogulonicigenium vulgare WSH-001]ALJ81077.1 DNA photolyase [Ketogulonicigenium vulgare]ANW33832.1 DNA photolyase [Ketogulonicigenium vulgare]AOZ54647.1 deoxyribodipyrimidine photolyase [Ketogulonicigenium vulgare]
MTAPGLFWLSRDFRFADNPALAAACTDGPLLAVFCVDDLLMSQGAASRWRLEQALRAFDAALRKRTGGRGVLVLRGEPDRILPALVQNTGAQRIHQSDWPTAGMRAVQDRLRAALAPLGAGLELHGGHLLAHPAMLRSGAGTPYRVYTPFARALRQHGADRPGRDAPARITPCADDHQGLAIETLDLAPDMHRGRALLAKFALPAGAQQAEARLDTFLDQAAVYPAGRDHPDQPATSNLSEHLALGEISPRRIWAIASLRAAAEPALAPGITKFLSEVIWREFSWHLLIANPDLPTQPWRQEWSEFPWQQRTSALSRWEQAATGISLVDAGLREMRVTGRMHNRVRMVVASWLTKHMMTDWRLGLQHFADSLTDWDPAANAMNWQWVAGCGPDASPYFRIFNPVKQAEEFDKKGIYRRKWLAGFDGSAAPEAIAYHDSLPTDWHVARHWREDASDERLRGGREAALDAYNWFRSERAA